MGLWVYSPPKITVFYSIAFTFQGTKHLAGQGKFQDLRILVGSLVKLKVSVKMNMRP